MATDPAGRSIGPAPGDVLLAALAEAALKPPRRHTNGWEERHVLVCRRELESRHTAEDKRRRAENERMISARQISIEESFDRKVADIDQRIRTLRAEGKPATIHMFESQRRTQDYRRRQALHRLEEARAGSLELEYVALCALEAVTVTPSRRRRQDEINDEQAVNEEYFRKAKGQRRSFLDRAPRRVDTEEHDLVGVFSQDPGVWLIVSTEPLIGRVALDYEDLRSRGELLRRQLAHRVGPNGGDQLGSPSRPRLLFMGRDSSWRDP